MIKMDESSTVLLYSKHNRLSWSNAELLLFPLTAMTLSTTGADPTMTNSPQPGGDESDAVIVIAAVVAFMMVLIGVVVVCIILVAVLKCLKGGRIHSYRLQRPRKCNSIDNPVYDGE